MDDTEDTQQISFGELNTLVAAFWGDLRQQAGNRHDKTAGRTITNLSNLAVTTKTFLQFISKHLPVIHFLPVLQKTHHNCTTETTCLAVATGTKHQCYGQL